MDKEAIIKVVTDNINLGGLVADVLDEILEPALMNIVEKTDNPYDNMLMLALYPLIEAELNKLTEKGINALINKITEEKVEEAK